MCQNDALQIGGKYFRYFELSQRKNAKNEKIKPEIILM